MQTIKTGDIFYCCQNNKTKNWKQVL